MAESFITLVLFVENTGAESFVTLVTFVENTMAESFLHWLYLLKTLWLNAFYARYVC